MTGGGGDRGGEVGEPRGRGREDYHDPTAGVGGAVPARSALTLRLVLAGFGAVICALGAVVFVVVVYAPVPATVFAVLAAVAIVDAVVVARRKRHEERG